jgi:hypothetical protein
MKDCHLLHHLQDSHLSSENPDGFITAELRPCGQGPNAQIKLVGYGLSVYLVLPLF